MITDLVYKPFFGDEQYREGKVYCRLWDTEISVQIYDEAVTAEYAEKCAEAMNNMPDELLESICEAAKLYCNDFRDAIGDDLADEMTVPIDADSPASEIMKCFTPAVLVIEEPADPSRIGYQLECNCDWEEEHGMEIDILDNKLVFLSEFTGDSPWGDHTDQSWNYALQI